MTNYSYSNRISTNIVQDLFEFYQSIPGNLDSVLTSYRRKMVDRAVMIRGESEPEKIVYGNTSDLLLLMAQKTSDYIYRDITKLKTAYARKLFSLVKEGNITDFFNDLENGLDYVIEKWDKDPVYAKTMFYSFEPSGANVYGTIIRVLDD